LISPSGSFLEEQGGKFMTRLLSKLLVATALLSGPALADTLTMPRAAPTLGYSTRVPYSETLKVCHPKEPVWSRNFNFAAEIATERKARAQNSAQIGRMMANRKV
jgi:hypothetical protein